MGKQITTSLGNKTRFRQLVDSFGLPRIIITGFLLLHHNGKHGVLIQLTALAQFFHPLRLGQ